jgi:PAS domain S-box-containing protein
MTEDHRISLSPQEREGRFDLLATEAKEYALFLVEPGGRLICWNPGAERLFGYRADEIIGQHFSRFFSPEDVRNGQPEHELKTASDTGRSDSVRWQVRKDGTRFWCQSVVTPLLDETKQARSFARVMHDLTESQATQAQRQRADGLAEANRNKEEFMALLSHELRSPLSPIVNALSILRQMRTSDPIIENAGHIIDRQVSQMVRLVDDLLDISRITKGKLRLTKERWNCGSSPTTPPRRYARSWRPASTSSRWRCRPSRFGSRRTRPAWSRSWSTCSTMRRSTPTRADSFG